MIIPDYNLDEPEIEDNQEAKEDINIICNYKKCCRKITKKYVIYKDSK